MKKKAELLTLTMIFLLVLVIGVYFYEGKEEARNIGGEPYYVGDSSINISYNIRSDNPLCNFGEIKIGKGNIVPLGNIEQVKLAGFNISNKCP